MKTICVIVAVLALNSCNTLIGVGRDTKQGFIWSKNKIQGNSGYSDAYDAPVY
jgi:hypothetical protein